jgi:hypothetical protein
MNARELLRLNVPLYIISQTKSKCSACQLAQVRSTQRVYWRIEGSNPINGHYSLEYNSRGDEANHNQTGIGRKSNDY